MLPKVPAFFVASKGEHSAKVGLILSTAQQHLVVRFTGGCGHMSQSDAVGLYELFVDAFVRADFNGALLYGGTRMLKRSDHSQVVPGITEIPPLIAQRIPTVVTFGVVPKTSDLALDVELGFVVSQEENNDFVTIVHPNQSAFLIVQRSVDLPATWDTEWEECMNIIDDMRKYGLWRSLLICYNGGGVSERELVATAQRGWPVILIAGSGRISSKYSEDQDFLAKFPNVIVAEKSTTSISNELMRWTESRRFQHERSIPNS